MSDKKHTALDSLGLWATISTGEIIEINDYGNNKNDPQLILTKKDLMKLNQLVDIKICECPSEKIPLPETYELPKISSSPSKIDWFFVSGFAKIIRNIFYNK